MSQYIPIFKGTTGTESLLRPLERTRGEEISRHLPDSESGMPAHSGVSRNKLTLFYVLWRSQKPTDIKMGQKKCSGERLLKLLCIFFFFFLGLYPWHMEVPRLGFKSELQLPAYTTARTQDPNHVCDLHHSSQQCQVLNPLSEARD